MAQDRRSKPRRKAEIDGVPQDASQEAPAGASADRDDEVADRTPTHEALTQPGLIEVATGGGKFPVVGIGASAGGLQAFEAFFSAMPSDSTPGMAFVVVQHLSPDHRSLLVEIVRRYTPMNVHEAVDRMRLEPNNVYIIPPNRELTYVDGSLRVTEGTNEPGHRLTVDQLFRSLAEGERERAIGIVMSGTGSDGSLGLRAIKGEGGMVIAQAPDSTEYDGMPRSAIATGMVDYVLTPAEMPARLLAFARHAFGNDRQQRSPVAHESVLKKICKLLRAQTGHDFSQYKESTLVRRIERRMALHQIQDADDYLRHAREHAVEVEALFRDLLIGVTSFFRDPDAFDALQSAALPRLFAAKAEHDTVRVWVCGCSTGEEAYSLAILLHEYALAQQRVYKIHVFATDIDHFAIEQARAGVYPASIAADVSEERLARCFVHDPQLGTYRIQKHIRDMLVFSEQDVIKDPAFSRLDLVSCRNLLIYLNQDIQTKLIPLFHYALNPGGVLFLGPSETVGEHARLFDVVDRRWKLFVKLAGDGARQRPPLPDFVPPLYEAAQRRATMATAVSLDEGTQLRQITERALLAHYAQAAVLVNARGQILHIFGRTGNFLEPADGDATLNVLTMAREGLRHELSMALHRVVAHGEPVTYLGLRVRANGHHVIANVTVAPVDTVGALSPKDVFLVVLEEVDEPPARADAAPAADAGSTGRIAALEQELRAKDEYLQTALEEMETTNEELKSTNEELQSVNEELQSTNEELETSKEELQSVNEELSTVNSELQDRVADLSRANNDMNNLLAGTGIGTVFVDHKLNLARFTPSATQIINLIPSDVGRPLAHVVANVINYDHMIADIRSVLDTLLPREAEVEIRNGSWYLMRIRPYRTSENIIEGAVVTFVDISDRRRAEQKQQHGEARLQALVRQAYAGVAETDTGGRFRLVNDRLCQMLGYTREELLQRTLRDVTEPADHADVEQQIDAVLRGGAEAQADRAYLRKDGGRVLVRESVSAIQDGEATTLLFVSFDLARAAGTSPPN